MEDKFIKGFIAGFFTFIIMIFIAAGASGYIGYKLLKGRLEYNSRSLRTTGIVVGTLLSDLRSELAEDLSQPAQKSFDTRWSAFFNKMVRDSKDRSDSFRIEEIVLLNRQGDILAHSDVSKLSKYSSDDKDKKEMLRVGSRAPGSPFSVKILSIVKNDGLMDPRLYEIAGRFIPDLMAETYSVGVAVFPVDSEIANASLHLTLRNTEFSSFYSRLKRTAIKVAVADIAACAFISLFVMIVVMIVANKKNGDREKAPQKAMRVSAAAELPRGMEIYEPESQPIPAGGEIRESGVRNKSVILDAIPLDDIRRGS